MLLIAEIFNDARYLNMTGKRLLDAIAMFTVSRAVASQHLAIRFRQLGAYSKTATLAKAVKKQTDSAAQASPSHTLQLDVGLTAASVKPASASIPDQKASLTRGSESVRIASALSKGPEGLEQDHHYRFEDGTVTDATPNEELHVRQEKSKRHPLPDGTIPTAQATIGKVKTGRDIFNQVSAAEPAKKPLEQSRPPSTSLEPESSCRSSIPEPDTDNSQLSRPLSKDARLLQCQSESQIPSTAAEPPGQEAYVVQGSPSHDGPDLGMQQGSDTFYNTPDSVSSVLSALPRVKLPKNVSDAQGGGSHVNQNVNADVFYSSSDGAGKTRTQREPEMNEPLEEMVNQIFHSPRVARILGSKGKSEALKPENPSAAPAKPMRLEKVAREDKPEVQSRQSNIATQSARGEFERGPWAKREDDGITDIATDIAKDAGHPQINLEENVAGSQAPYEMRESRVPSSRYGRIWQYGGLAASMAFGAAGESLKRATGSGSGSHGSLMLSPGNIERLVAKLSKMRGAALKLGQMISFQDLKMLPRPIHEVLQRVQDSADYMPASQRNSVLASELGADWRNLFDSFDEKPIAAASIGQVHSAILKSNGQRVAVKVQYPGVAASLSSDLNNLSLLLTASRLLPKGLYLEKTIANARTELAWECDYVREAGGAKRFKELLADEADVFTVPKIYDEVSGKQVLTMERMEGQAITKVQNLSQAQKDWIGAQILRLCLREIMEFRYMQTDPNWTNFLYNQETGRIELLDFGASREYPKRFIDLYARNLAAASERDRDACQQLSLELGYLTGYESQAMLDAHIESVMTLAEPFTGLAPDTYDFRNQTITDRVRNLIPVMVRERLAPPPEETYSLHRKLSGAFLLCARLGSRVKCKGLLQQALARAGIQ